MGIVVREPVVDDVEALARINIDTWRAAYAGIVPQTRIDRMDLATYRRRWLDSVTAQRPGVACLVAEIDGILASYAVGGPYRPQEDAAPEMTDRLGELYAIYVDPPMQRRGAGAAVHDALLEKLVTQWYTEAALWVLVANEASRAWYARRGWRPDGATSLWMADGEGLAEVRLRRRLQATT